MRGLEGRGKYSERGRRKNTKRDTGERKQQNENGGTGTPNEVRQQTSVTCVK